MMTAQQSALYALMEEQGYSYGLLNAAIYILGQSKEGAEEMINYICDEHPSEEAFISHLAEVCEGLSIDTSLL